MFQTCKNCQQSFEIAEDDLKFYKKVSPIFEGKKYLIPVPSLCPECRHQRMAVWRNERSIYKRKCGLCFKEIISEYSPDKNYITYCKDCFWSDNWNQLEYGFEFNFSKSFFKQFKKLMEKTPVLALFNVNTYNSEYCHRIFEGRNNYLSFIALYEPENLIHTFYTISCKDSIDITYSQKIELGYELTDAENSYNCKFSHRIKNCSDSWFLEDCIGCKYCISCKNLHQKQYCIFNKQYSKEGYFNFIKDTELHKYSVIQKIKNETAKFFLSFPNRDIIKINCENSVGGNIERVKNSYQVYDAYELENVRYCTMCEKSNNCIDCFGFGCNEFSSNSISLEYVSNLNFCATIANCSNLLYCYHCSADTSNCFGCVGLKKKRYCILNKQYTKEEYEKLVPKIIEAMKSPKSPLTRGLGHPLDKGGLGDCEWGEFFPSSISPFGYNETVAQEYFPLTKEQALSKGFKWSDYELEFPHVEKTIPANLLPEIISEIPDDILNWAIQCEVTGKPFKIIKPELDFYRKMNLSIPRRHPDQRHKDRMALRNPRKLWKRNCIKCNAEIQTTYVLEKPEMVYCEDCYLKSVY